MENAPYLAFKMFPCIKIHFVDHLWQISDPDILHYSLMMSLSIEICFWASQVYKYILKIDLKFPFYTAVSRERLFFITQAPDTVDTLIV